MLRVYQWTKSGFIFLPFVFSDYLLYIKNSPLDPESLAIVMRLLSAFFGFSFLASSVYVMNDWKDREQDRLDPRKMRRPLASGDVSPVTGFLVFLALLSGALVLGFFLSKWLLVIFLIYFGMNVFYSLLGKRIILVDVFIISIGFVLRVLAGAVALNIEASPWLLSCTFFIALFLGFFKRFYEIKVGPAEILVGGIYNADTLKQFINITAALSIMNYTIYSLQGRHANAHLVWTVPFVVLGIFRYYMLLQNPESLREGNPSDILLADKFLILIILLWVLLCAALILWVQKAG